MNKRKLDVFAKQQKNPKPIKYPCTICVRVSEDTRSNLESETIIEDMGLSDVARKILEAHYEKGR